MEPSFRRQGCLMVDEAEKPIDDLLFSWLSVIYGKYTINLWSCQGEFRRKTSLKGTLFRGTSVKKSLTGDRRSVIVMQSFYRLLSALTLSVNIERIGCIIWGVVFGREECHALSQGWGGLSRWGSTWCDNSGGLGESIICSRRMCKGVFCVFLLVELYVSRGGCYLIHRWVHTGGYLFRWIKGRTGLESTIGNGQALRWSYGGKGVMW